ncbi:MAG: hypothetical protein J5803_00505 [Desulfovibrio sp.]|nr:hypothetical protein [Desulfovibrio sp.]
MQELKVYGHIYPADKAFEEALQNALEGALCDAISSDVPLLERDHDMLRISFEGRYFPEEEVLAVFSRFLLPSHKGKLDVLNMLDWRLTRYLFQEGTLVRREVSLNHVLDYSGF